MADIKTRDVTRGTIKTLDRAASSMHHLKEASIRSKAAEISSNNRNESAESYAQESVEHFAGDSSVYAAKAGVELILRAREQNSGETVQSDENIHHLRQELPFSDRTSNKNDEKIHHAFREQGIRNIRSRQAKSRMADAEVDRAAEYVRNTRRIRGSAGKRAENLRRIGRKPSAAIKTFTGEELIQKQRKQHAIDRIVSRQSARAQNLIMMFRRSGDKARRVSAVANSFIRYLWAHARSYILALGAGGTAAVIILTLFVFFGIGTITFSNNSPETSITENQEEIIYFIPDLTGSPTRVAIVKAAAREVGNVGGEKFWRWYGFNGHVHWCACFTSYIAAECGCIKSGICPKSALVYDWVSFYKKQHRWARGDYIPHSGDFIIFDWDDDGSPDHIGIVESCDGKTVFTIEGNSGDACKRRTYARGSGVIYGYGCPNYSGT